MPVHAFARAALTPTPWKNGGGVTREIVCRPAAAGLEAFAWRASIASIAADGPFSAFPGVDRVIVLLEGGDVHLRSEDGRVDHRLRPLAPFAFDGETALAAALLDGPSTDFNVMTRRAAWRADVQVLRAGAGLAAAPAGVLFAAAGAWTAAERTLAAGAGVWWDEEPCAWRVEPRDEGAALLAVRLWPREGRR